MRAMSLQQFTELLDGKARIAGNTAPGECIDRIVARNRHDTLTIAHDDMLALAHDTESGLFKRVHGVEVTDAWDLGQG